VQVPSELECYTLRVEFSSQEVLFVAMNTPLLEKPESPPTVPSRVTLHGISWKKFKVITSSRKTKRSRSQEQDAKLKAAANYFFCGSGCKLRLVQILGSKEGLPNKFSGLTGSLTN
jgi:hypothetical protein